ncbi:MAG: hypothetical protein A3F11_03370 [Gammaproteobacteria bacterium RIFCSPHIGHO2_12_FULL_37_14]|nr:MAG: hypothetical protein A3F11_03370 [Gammaproteobacteria bacterium RIFCSPHIGHO2_12_FULL_37_14]
MKIAVVGLWHLGCVTAACLASINSVIAYDPDQQVIDELQRGKTPIFEPGLDDLLAAAQNNQKLIFSSEPTILAEADIIWITFDTPVDDNDIADTLFVTEKIKAIFLYLKQNTLVLISSQLPAGSTRKLQSYCAEYYPGKNITFAYSPENLRLGKAIDVFTKPDRIVIGLQCVEDKARVEALLHPLSHHLIWMSLESAEMTKHALNAFLATSVVFINELATLCEQVGANAQEVERGLKTEERIGPKAYLRPGNAIAGGTLARDVNYLTQIGQQHNITTPFFSSLLQSNEAHKQWSCRRLLEVFKELKNKTITVLGLTYKVGTDTLRRSISIEICEWLNQQGAKVLAYDPQVSHLPNNLNAIIQLSPTLSSALTGADAVIVSTEWPDFCMLSAEDILSRTQQAIVFDPSGFLRTTLGNDPRIRYFSVGRSA